MNTQVFMALASILSVLAYEEVRTYRSIYMHTSDVHVHMVLAYEEVRTYRCTCVSIHTRPMCMCKSA